MMKKLILVLIMITIFSCKNDKNERIESKDTKEIIVNEVKNKNILSFNINAIVSGNDEFTVYYLGENDKEISNSRSISKNIIGSEVQQTLKFDFPEGMIPIKLLFKTGKNQDTKVDIIDASFVLNDIKFEIPGGRFFNYFIPNEFIEFDKVSSSYTLKTAKGKFNPIFFSRKVLIDKIEFLFY